MDVIRFLVEMGASVNDPHCVPSMSFRLMHSQHHVSEIYQLRVSAHCLHMPPPNPRALRP